MPGLLGEEVAKQLRERVRALRRPVRLLFFTQQHACGACAEQHKLLEELAALSPKLKLEVRELVSDFAEAKRYAIDKVPATAVLAQDRDFGIRFYGLTGGYEFGSLVEAILMASGGESGLEPAVDALARRIAVPTHLEVMVTLTCPYCPRMVQLAHPRAFVNEHVRAHMEEAS